MHRRRLLPFVLFLIAASACEDRTPVAPVAPDNTQPRYAVSGGGGTNDLRAGLDYVCVLRSGMVNCYGSTAQGQPHGMHRALVGSFVALGGGQTHACAVRSDGAAECFGSNLYGEAPPVVLPTVGTFTRVSAGVDHSCALRSNGSLQCWGANDYDQAPHDWTAQTGTFTDVAADAFRTCALRTDGAVECRGFRFESPQVNVSPFGTYVLLAQSVGATNCVVRSTEMLECWGNQPSSDTYTGQFLQVTVGASHICELRPGNVAECSGFPYSWETSDKRSIAGRVYPRISAGTFLTCGLRPDAYFECFGSSQTIGSNAPDVVPDSTSPTASLRTGLPRLAWTDVNSNELRTEVQRSLADASGSPTTWAPVASLAANHMSFADATATPNATYFYRIRVCNNAGCSGWAQSNALRYPSAPPPAPTVTGAAGHACGFASCIKVNWTDDITFVDTFRVQRRAKTGSTYGAWAEVWRRFGRQETYFDDYGLTVGTTYQYRVAACNVRGCSGYVLSPAVVAPAPPPPHAPSDVSAYKWSSYMQVNWTDVLNETTYEEQRRQDDGTAWSAWSDPMVKPMNVTDSKEVLKAGLMYQWRVRACNDGGCSDYTYSDPTQG
jgi:hypothetical protein